MLPCAKDLMTYFSHYSACSVVSVKWTQFWSAAVSKQHRSHAFFDSFNNGNPVPVRFSGFFNNGNGVPLEM